LRKLALLLLLVAILAGLTAISKATDTWHYVVPAEPGELLYTATFDGWLDEWEVYEGRLSAQVDNGRLRIGVDTAQSAPFSTAAPFFDDFDVQAQASAVGGPLNNGYGIIFRVQRDENRNPVSY